MKKKTSVIIAVILVLIVAFGAFYLLSNRNMIKVRNAEKTTVSDVTVFNESINISVDDVKANTYTLVNADNLSETTEYTTTEYVDQGIEANDIENGKYYVKLGENYLTADGSEAFEDIEFYTITRDDKNQKVTITNDVKTNAIVIEKEDSELPDEVYDIIIDPGHGGIDSGASGADGVTNESELTLEISLMLKEKLEAEGYKVAITRTEDVNPGTDPEGLENYGEGSRIGQVYETGAKMNISMHYNTGYNSGYEVYTSVNTSTELADIFESEIQESLTPSNRIDYCDNGNCKVPLTWYSQDQADSTIDYLFAIREVAGRNLETFSEDNAYISDSAVGAEGILLESGYIDNLEDLEYLSSEDTMDAETTEIVNAINTYVYQ